MRHILAVMAHPDDAELWAGGVLAQHVKGGGKATVLLSCDDKDRIREAHAGAEVLGAELRTVDRLDLRNCIVAIEEIQPDVVICHRWDDPHPDHRLVGDAVTSAAQKAAITLGRRGLLYTCDTYESLTLGGLVPGRTVINIDDTFQIKVAALRKHESQPIDHFVAMARRQAEMWGARIGCRFGEAFDPVPVLGVLPVATQL